MGEHLGERQQRAGAGPACPRCSHHLHRHGGQRQLVRSRARAHVAQCTCASIYRRAAQREGRRRRTGDAGKRRAGEGCGSVPAPQQHGCRRSSRAQGLDARPVPPSRPLAHPSQSAQSTTEIPRTARANLFGVHTTPAQTTGNHVSITEICCRSWEGFESKRTCGLSLSALPTKACHSHVCPV